jgi:3-hydroxybutyryl-CoA dehydrogenase
MVQKIGVVGAGQMGRGIAQSLAMSGFEVRLHDISELALSEGLAFISMQLSKGIKKDKWDDTFVKEVLSKLEHSIDIKKLHDCDVIIEASTENKNIKFEIFKSLDEIAKESCILASNTSSISITEIAARTNRPEKVVGMHFMNPVPVMKLIEGIRGLETSDDTFQAIKNMTKKMSKVLIESRDMPGFVVNRILMPMINEAVYALYEGLASVEDIDQAMKLGTNQPMGPLTLADFIGLDTCLSIMEVLHEGFGDSKYRPCPLLKQYVLSGRLGRKVKRGFYEYE